MCWKKKLCSSFMHLYKNVKYEEIYSLFSIIGLCEFSKLDCAWLANHLKKIILNSVIWNSSCGSCHQTTPFPIQTKFMVGEKGNEKVGPELLPEASQLPGGHIGRWKCITGVYESSGNDPTGLYIQTYRTMDSMHQWQQESSPSRRVVGGQAFRGTMEAPYSIVGVSHKNWPTLCVTKQKNINYGFLFFSYISYPSEHTDFLRSEDVV